MAAILLVEDDAAMRAYATLILERRGHTVACAQDGGEAVRMMRHDVPDLVVSDHEMPGLNGTDLHNAMRAYVSLRDVPMILITAFDSSAMVHQLRSVVAQVLYKPLRRDELLAAVDTALACGEAARS